LDKRWQLVMHVGSGNITTDLGPEVPYVVLPVSAIFDSVYDTCRKILASQVADVKPKKTKRARRARS
jgi:hypothetical protein